MKPHESLESVRSEIDSLRQTLKAQQSLLDDLRDRNKALQGRMSKLEKAFRQAGESISIMSQNHAIAIDTLGRVVNDLRGALQDVRSDVSLLGRDK